jgi:hypothetical protein
MDGARLTPERMKMPPRCCVYTTLYGTFDTLPEQPVRQDSQLDFIAFVGDPTLVSETWTLRHLPPRIAADPVRSSRYPKLHPHLLLPEYQASLYIDCSVQLKHPPEALFEALLFGQTETMACLRHSHRDNVLDEVRAVLHLGYDDPDRCLQQLCAYADTGFRGTVPLTWSGVMLRFHHHPDVSGLMEAWWEHVLRFSRRDQLSFGYLAEKRGFSFAAHALDNEDSPWHRWPVPRERERAQWTPARPPPGADAFQMRLRDTIDEIAATLERSRMPREPAAPVFPETGELPVG